MITKTFQTNLLRWYDQNKRALPWRLLKSPYRTFVSEIMLQQTQIKTVLPYFKRWMKTFPTIEKLAKADIGKVLKLWEGLGYYSRARNLHKASQIIVEKYKGAVPSDYDSLIALPGIGRYTAGAIGSIAFNLRVPLVDGNVSRVFTRVFNIREDITKPDTQKELYKIADRLVPAERPGDFNQALMELGSLVCFPALPNCGDCPVQKICMAQKKGNQESLPVKSKQLVRKNIHLLAGIIRHQNKILVRERAASGIWGGLWELPNFRLENNLKAGNKYACSLLQKNLGISLNSLDQKFVPLTHRLTHLDVTIYPFLFETKHNGVKEDRYLWADKLSIKELSFPVPFQKIIKLAFHE